jgi:trehalose-phosphatase
MERPTAAGATRGAGRTVSRGRGLELWDRWDAVAARLAEGPLLACFDYDGTLVPIQPTPEEAVADDATRAALSRLAGMEGVRTAIVSGRPVAQLRELLPVPGLWLIGTHGLELGTPDGDTLEALDREACTAALDGLRRRAVAIEKLHPGTRVEDKGPALALHTRLAERAVAAGAAELFERAAAEVPGFSVMAGKEVLEARPDGADKGSAVRRLRAPGETVLYVGDDVTDEDAFAALAADREAVTVRVGRPRPTAARYRVAAQEDVALLLARLTAARRRGAQSMK